MKKIYVLLLAFIMSTVYGQGDGSLDTNFNFNNTSPITTMARETNGNTILAIDEDGHVLRINNTGGIDPNLNLTVNFGDCIIFPLNDGSFLIGGLFTYVYNGYTYKKILKYSSSGQLITTFKFNGGGDFSPMSFAVQPVTGKILVGGWAGSFGVSHFYRIDSNTGIIDTSFVPFVGNDLEYPTYTMVTSIATYPNGDMMLGGNFQTHHGILRAHALRLFADGSLDTSYNLTGIDVAYTVKKVAIQSDGYVLIGGDFNHSSGHHRILRTNQFGVIDNTFNPQFPAQFYSQQSPIYDIGIQKCDGKIVLVGEFTAVNNYSRNGIVRLNKSDGSTDTTFNPGTGSNTSAINQVTLDPNDKIYIAGSFSSYNGTTLNAFNRLKGGIALITATPATATILNGATQEINIFDNVSYNGATATTSDVTVELISNTGTSGITFNATTGKISVGSTIKPAPGTYVYNYRICPKSGCGPCKESSVTIVIKLPAIHAVDDLTITVNGCQVSTYNLLANDTYNSELITSANINKVTVQDMGFFGTLISINSSGILTVAETMAAGTYALQYKVIDVNNSQNYDIAQVKIKIIGPIVAENDVLSVPNGTGGSLNVISNDTFDCKPLLPQDASLKIYASLISSSNSGITLDADTAIVNVSTTVPVGIYTLVYKICDALNVTSNCDNATVTITVLTPSLPSYSVRANNLVSIIKTQNNNKIIIAGGFTAYNYQSVNKIARLNPDLTLDSFNTIGITGTGSYGVQAMEVQKSNDYILVGGRFIDFNGAAANDLIRLDKNGTPDPTFSSGSGVALSWNISNKVISAIAVQNDGRIIIAGDFDSYKGQPRKGIARLYPNGDLDPSFNPGNGFLNQSGPCSIAIQPDGNIVVTGNFTSYQGYPRNKIARLLSNGNIDPSFVPGNNVSAGAVDDFKVLLQPDGYIIFYGKFTNYNGTGKNNIVRLKGTDGTVDPTFTGTGTTSGTKIWAAEIDPITGHIYVGGSFTSMNENTNNYYFGRFTNTGVVDNSFIGGYGASYHIYSLKRQIDGKIILGGTNFNSYNSVAFSPANNGNITRINPSIVGSQQRTINNDIEKTINSITIYPNPSEGLYNIDFKGYEEQKFDITIHNTLGQLIYQGVVTSENTNQIDLTRFESGSYYITLLSNAETINKVVIKK